MSMLGKCALQWPEGFSVVLSSSVPSVSCWRLCRLKPLSQANDDCNISKQLMTFSFILTGSWLFRTFYAFYFLPLVSLSIEKQSSLCVWGPLITSSQGSKYRKPSKGVFLGVIINKISSWVPEEDGLPRAQRISNRGALLTVCTHSHFLIQTVQCFQESDYSSKSRK